MKPISVELIYTDVVKIIADAIWTGLYYLVKCSFLYSATIYAE